MKRRRETTSQLPAVLHNTAAAILPGSTKGNSSPKPASKGRLRPEVAIPVTVGLLAVAAGAVAIKVAIDRKAAKENRTPKPRYATVAFSLLDEVDRDLGSNTGWSIAERPPQKRPRNQVLVVAAEAKDVGVNIADPHGTSDTPALAVRTDNGVWHVGRLPEAIATAEQYDSWLVVGMALDRQSGMAACLGRLTNKGFFMAAPSSSPPTDQVMDARFFAESYDTLIVRS